MSSADRNEEGPTVHLPDELPVLTPPVSRILLAVLVELTEVQPPEELPEEGSHDR